MQPLLLKERSGVCGRELEWQPHSIVGGVNPCVGGVNLCVCVCVWWWKSVYMIMVKGWFKPYKEKFCMR